MIPFKIIIFFLVIHFIGDFILQNDNDAKSKWNNFPALLRHVTTYAGFLLIGVLLAALPSIGLQVLNLSFKECLVFVLVNFALHLFIDFVTSKITHYYFDRGDQHNGFVIIGFDQLMHYICLFGTYLYLI